MKVMLGNMWGNSMTLQNCQGNHLGPCSISPGLKSLDPHTGVSQDYWCQSGS